MKQVRVLVVDDSLTIRAILEAILERHADINIIGLVSDAEEARAVLLERQPDVITLDLALPGMDGMAFLRELAEGPHPPVLVLSSSTTKGSAQAIEALECGAHACFDKAGLVLNAERFVRAVRKAAEVRYKLFGRAAARASAS